MPCSTFFLQQFGPKRRLRFLSGGAVLGSVLEHRSPPLALSKEILPVAAVEAGVAGGTTALHPHGAWIADQVLLFKDLPRGPVRRFTAEEWVQSSLIPTTVFWLDGHLVGLKTKSGRTPFILFSKEGLATRSWHAKPAIHPGFSNDFSLSSGPFGLSRVVVPPW